MYFNSYEFIMLFFPSVLVLYFLSNHYKKYTLGKFILLCSSIIFYGWFNYKALVPIVVISTVNYWLGNKKRAKSILAAGIIFNIGVLGYFKYTNFFIDTVNHLFSKETPLLTMWVPIGLSFFTFQQICFLVDSSKRELHYSFCDYLLHSLFFPYIISGPIVRHDQIIPQFNEEGKKQFCMENFQKGVFAFSIGLAEKVLLADTLAKAANIGFGDVNALNSTSAIIVTLAYTFQIYFDFSGYSNMVTGIGMMLNLEMPMNFNSPYRALSINDFWKRWHMSLTKFFTEYVYFPLGGNRKGKGRTYFNVFIIFFLSGLWHGANWTFIIWGILHGAASILTRIFHEQWEKLHTVIKWLATFSFINITWVFFRAESVKDAVQIIKYLFSGYYGALPQELVNSFLPPEITFIIYRFLNDSAILQTMFINLLFILCLILSVQIRNVNERLKTFCTDKQYPVLYAVLFVWAVVSLAGIPTFIYVNF